MVVDDHLDLLHYKGEEIREDSQQVNHIQWSLHKVDLVRGAGQSGAVLCKVRNYACCC